MDYQYLFSNHRENTQYALVTESPTESMDILIWVCVICVLNSGLELVQGFPQDVD